MDIPHELLYLSLIKNEGTGRIRQVNTKNHLKIKNINLL